jgi:hypothetical protein
VGATFSIEKLKQRHDGSGRAFHQPLAAIDRTVARRRRLRLPANQLIVQRLMVALRMVVRN